MSEKDQLIRIGLSNREADAYLALLQLQEATVADIAKKTNESRTHLYDTLRSLISRGLVSYVVKNNIKFFHAAPPEKILDYLKEKEHSILSILPNLKAFHQIAFSKPFVEVYEDKEGMKTILNDILRTRKDWFAIGTTGKSRQILPLFFIQRFHKERIKNKIKLKTLINQTGEGVKLGEEFKTYSLTEVKYLPKTHESPMTIYIYGNKTVLLLWLAGDRPFAILIQSKEISASFKSYFNILWQTAKE
ncbi:helix-turn-helix domain-containing protein [Candidatus Woesearchaeota archaeon]|nr:helix-turn-helix domain-containing protein [Candidatus Woesearchaeota archaeon]